MAFMNWMVEFLTPDPWIELSDFTGLLNEELTGAQDEMTGLLNMTFCTA